MPWGLCARRFWMTVCRPTAACLGGTCCDWTSLAQPASGIGRSIAGGRFTAPNAALLRAPRPCSRPCWRRWRVRRQGRSRCWRTRQPLVFTTRCCARCTRCSLRSTCPDRQTKNMTHDAVPGGQTGQTLNPILNPCDHSCTQGLHACPCLHGLGVLWHGWAGGQAMEPRCSVRSV
jgi:hypothetical protein